jgi:hypothetical protein
MFDMIDSLRSGVEVPIHQLALLDQALRKATDVGYQTPTNVSGAGSISALVPQSIEDSLTSAEFTMEHIVFWKDLPKRNVTQTVHEYNRLESHGLDIDPFIAEGGAGVTNQATYSRQNVRVKYLAIREEVTDVANMVGITGPSANAIAEATQRGTEKLMQLLEKQLFYGNEAKNALGFDGVFQQIEDGAPSNVTDMAGSALDLDTLGAILGEMGGAPNYAMPDVAYVEPRVHQDLIALSRAHGRHDHVQQKDGTITYGIPGLRLATPYGYVTVKSAPFLHRSSPMPTTGSDSSLTVNAFDSAAAAPAAGSLFLAADAGDYQWGVIAVKSDGAYGPPRSTGTISVAAGDDVQIDLDDIAEKAAGIVYYRVFRTAKDDPTGTKFHLFDVPVNEDGDATSTLITDLNATKPKTSKALVIKRDPMILEWVQLLPFMRRPLAEVATSRPFLLMLFGAPVVKVPTKCWVLDNVGLATSA